MNELKRKKLGWFPVPNIFVDYVMREIGTDASCIYFSIARHRNENTGISWPSQKLIANELGISVRTVQRHISKLVECNLITRRKRRGSGYWENYEYKLTEPKEWRVPFLQVKQPYDNLSYGDIDISSIFSSDNTTKTTGLHDINDKNDTTESHIKNTNYINTKEKNTNNTQKAELSGDERKQKYRETKEDFYKKEMNSTPP